MTTRRTTSKTLPPTSRQWFMDGTDGETELPLSEAKKKTLLRKASAERQLQYDNGGQPLAVLEELVILNRSSLA